MHRVCGVVMVAVAAAMSPPALRAQEACTWDSCALRVNYGLFSTRVVRGIRGESVARLTLFPTTIPPLATAGDSARLHYDAFRNRQGVAATFTLLALATSVAFFATWDIWESDGRVAGFLGASLAFTLIGGISANHARNSLNRAIWHYNRDLPR
jgi:hypothetical protein